MKKLILIITILSFGLMNSAQVADSLDVNESDTIIVKKNKTIRIMYGDKELLNVDINADEFDLDIDENAKGDTTKLRIGKRNIIIIEDGDDKVYSFDDDDDDYKSKKFKGHWSGLELGMNNYLNSNFELALPPGGEFMELNTNKSVEFSLNFIEKAFPIYKNRLGVVTGMGLKWNNYHFDKKTWLNQDDVTQTKIVIDTSFNKNKLGVTFLTVPLLLEYQIPVGKKKKPIYISTGIIGGIKIGSRVKREYSVVAVQDYEEKRKADFNLSPYTYSVTARLGYRNVNVFANYSMVSLFEKNKGPELYPFSIGISLLN